MQGILYLLTKKTNKCKKYTSILHIEKKLLSPLWLNPKFLTNQTFRLHKEMLSLLPVGNFQCLRNNDSNVDRRLHGIRLFESIKMAHKLTETLLCVSALIIIVRDFFLVF